MVVKRNDRQVHETIQMGNGVDVHFYDNTDSLENLKKYEEEYRKDYDNNPCLLYKVEYVYAKAERMQAEGNLDGAEKYLSAEIDSITDVTTEPSTLLRLMDVLTLEAELLLRLKRPYEALTYAERVNRIALKHFEDTVEMLYAAEVYGNCLQACGKDKDAKDIYTGTLNEIDREITDLEDLRDGIKANLKEIKA
jgi:tetratricopeptide (TPR) repeat protein